MKWIRWQGVVAFVVIVVGIAALWFLLADWLLERGIEAAGTEIVGARVELDGAELDLFPGRIELRGLAVTNPRSPMQNALEARRIAFGMSIGELVLGNLHVDEMAIDGAAVGTPRERSGAIRERALTRLGRGLMSRMSGGGGATGAALSLPSAGEVLTREKLQSVERIRALSEQAAADRRAIAERLDDLPGEERLARYRERLAEIRAQKEDGPLGAVKAARELAELREQISADLDEVRSVRRDISERVDSVRAAMAEARAAPGREAERLAAKYAPSGANLGNITGLLLGPRIGGWVASGWSWYERLRPYISSPGGGDGEVVVSKPIRAEGVDVIYPREDPVPETVFRRIGLSGAEAPEGGMTLGGTVNDLSLQPALWPRPLTLDLRGRGGSGAAFEVAGTLDHRDPERPSDRLRLSVNDLRIGGNGGEPDAPDSRLPARLAEARLDVNADAALIDGSLDVNVRGAFSGARFVPVGEAEGEVSRALAEALAGVDRFTLTARITGTPEAPEVSIDSSLEGVLRRAVGRLVEARVAELEKALQSRIEEQVREPLQELQSSLAAVQELDRRAADRLEAFRSLRDRL